MTRTKAIVILATTLISTTAISSAAFADSKIYSGGVCQAYLGSDEEKLIRGNPISPFIGHGNFSVSCPVIRNNTQSTGTNQVLVTVQRFNGASISGDGLKCELSVSNKGVPVSRKTKVAPIGIGQFTLDLTTNHVPGAAYSMLCFLPFNTSIVQYTTVEP